MAKRGGFSGIPGGMGNLMKQAQRMQRQMEEKQKELETKEFVGDAGGGVVSVSLNGKREVLSVKIDKEVVDPEDVETLEDLIAAAMGAALKRVNDETTASMDSITGGLGGLPF